MNHDFWHDKWQKGHIGFHEGTVNAYLKAHWPCLRRSETDSVFVPLCGKSHDLFWLNRLGHPVMGVELSPIACKDLFEEAGIPASVHQDPPFTAFVHGTLRVLCGDFFDLTPAKIRPARLAYDRAALIALPPDMRQKYVDHLNHLLPGDAEILLVTMEYPQDEMDGPPFAVHEDEVETLYKVHWSIEKLHENELGRDDPFAKRKGLSTMKEKVFHLVRRA